MLNSNDVRSLLENSPSWMDNLVTSVRFSVNYSTIWLWYTIFMTIIINIFLITIIYNLKTEYTWQKYCFYLLLLSINIFYFIKFYTIFLILFVLFTLLIIISSWQFIKNLYQDYMLQKVQDIKFKNIFSKQKSNSHKKLTIQEAFSSNITLWIQMLLQYMDREYGELWKLYLWLMIITLFNIVLLLAYIYIMYWSAYFIK